MDEKNKRIERIYGSKKIKLPNINSIIELEKSIKNKSDRRK